MKTKEPYLYLELSEGGKIAEGSPGRAGGKAGSKARMPRALGSGQGQCLQTKAKDPSPCRTQAGSAAA